MVAGCIFGSQRLLKSLALPHAKRYSSQRLNKTSKLGAMPNLYDTLISILRDHWKTHNNAYPQRIELSAYDMKGLLDDRQLVNDSMNFKPNPGWETHFLGTPVQAADVSCVIDVNGERIPVIVGLNATPD